MASQEHVHRLIVILAEWLLRSAAGAATAAATKRAVAGAYGQQAAAVAGCVSLDEAQAAARTGSRSVTRRRAL